MSAASPAEAAPSSSGQPPGLLAAGQHVHRGAAGQGHLGGQVRAAAEAVQPAAAGGSRPASARTREPAHSSGERRRTAEAGERGETATRRRSGKRARKSRARSRGTVGQRRAAGSPVAKRRAAPRPRRLATTSWPGVTPRGQVRRRSPSDVQAVRQTPRARTRSSSSPGPGRGMSSSVCRRSGWPVTGLGASTCQRSSTTRYSGRARPRPTARTQPCRGSLITETLGAPEDLPAAVEPGPPLIRITQQNPGTDPVFGVLMICAGNDPAARIGTITPVYGALGCRPGSAARGRFVGPLTLTGQGWRGT